jgi:hypothetical protein
LLRRQRSRPLAAIAEADAPRTTGVHQPRLLVVTTIGAQGPADLDAMGWLVEWR